MCPAFSRRSDLTTTDAWVRCSGAPVLRCSDVCLLLIFYLVFLGSCRTQGLTDCWKDAGSIKADGTTWDSNTNLYHRDGFGFSCRFDRIYSRGGLTTEAFSVAFNTPVQGTAGWYLSDHYGLVATLSLPGQCVRE